MLRLSFASQNETLARQMMLDLRKHWTDPLSPPLLIFPDTFSEQWFRLEYVKQFGIAANLKVQRIESFLWNSLDPDPGTKLIDSSVLAHVIQAALTSPVKTGAGEIPFWREIPELYHFLKKGTGTQLTDLSMELARLFLEYEYSRPSRFNENHPEGILDCWKEGHSKPFFSENQEEEDPFEKWQRKLYDFIFHRPDSQTLSFLEQAFEKIDDRETRYLTLTFLYNSRKDNLKKKLPEKVFILGLQGVSQFHRKILSEMAETNEIYVFIQNPCGEFWEDIPFRKKIFPNSIERNSLLQQWGQNGKENIKLWCKAADYDFEMLSEAPSDKRTVLSLVQQHIQSNRETVENFLEQDESILIFNAPNKKLEMESIREQIWKDLETDPTLRPDDILVLIPNINDYRISIQQTFGIPEPSDIDYLPYSLNHIQTNDSLFSQALDSFFKMCTQREINRLLFFELIQNPLVCEALEIDIETTEIWKDWGFNMNLFRSRKENSKEVLNPHTWKHGINRLLLGKWMSSPYPFSETVFYPYEDMNTGNEKNFQKFYESLEKLDLWIDLLNPAENTESSISKKIEAFTEFCNSFLSFKSHSREFSLYNTLFYNLKNLEWQQFCGRENISYSEFETIVQRALEKETFNQGSFFISGVSFLSFDASKIFPAKILYFAGMGSKDFPGSPLNATLDLRTYLKGRKPRWEGDTDTVSKNRYAFLLALMSAKEKIRLSFVGKDLKKDEDLYPSGVIEELKTYLEKNMIGKNFQIQTITLDETRPEQKIYSIPRLRQKFWNSAANEAVIQKPKHLWKSIPYPPSVQDKNIENFLRNPFEFQLRQRIPFKGKELNPLSELEPIELNPLQQSIIQKSLLQHHFFPSEGESLESLQDQGLFPEDFFGDITENTLKKTLEEYQKQLQGIEWLPKENIEIEINQTFVSSSTEWIGCDSKGVYTLINLSREEKKFHHYLRPFIKALIFCVHQNTPLSFNFLILEKKTKKNPKSQPLSITPQEARSKLSDMLEQMYPLAFSFNFPCEIFESGKWITREEFLKKINSNAHFFPQSLEISALFDKNDFNVPETEKKFQDIFEKHRNHFLPILDGLGKIK